jgi:hypothetical protein
MVKANQASNFFYFMQPVATNPGNEKKIDRWLAGSSTLCVTESF